MTFQERLEDLWETIKVKWFLMDAAQKQALLIVAVYLVQVGTEIVKAYVTAKVYANESRLTE